MAIRAYKFRLYPSNQQERLLAKHLEISRQIWNTLLEKSKEKYEEEKRFYSISEMQQMVKESGLFSQTAQAVCHRLFAAIEMKVKAKHAGRKCGFPRFKPTGRMKSLYYPQFGFHLGKKLKLTPFGEIAIRKHREISGKTKTLTVKRESSEKWFAIFCVETKGVSARINDGPGVGIDLGLKNFATLSDAKIIKNPRHIKKLEKKLASLQRKLSKKKKGSKNRQKSRREVSRAYERVANARRDFLHKTANDLLSTHSFIALENLRAQEMSQKNYGKWINDAAWKMFSCILAYKAESAGCRVVFVNPADTTKECSACGNLVEKSLLERWHFCPACGLSIDRDLNASINILKRATAGIAGSNACGDGAKGALSLKQEVDAFRCR